MNLYGKVVVVTGASKGLGAELTKMLAKEGAKLVACARNERELKEVAKATGATAITVDVSDENQVKKLAEAAVQKFGRIDIWINNAGTWLPHATAEDMDMKRVKEMIDTNLFGTMYGSREALKQMKKQKHGTIINIVSSSGLEGRAGSSGYAASKFGATGFTRSIRLETVNLGVKVIGVYPGGMKTTIFDEKKPENYGEFMNTGEVAKKIVENLKQDQPQEEQILKRNS